MYVLMLDTHIPIFEGVLNFMSVNRIELLYWIKYYNQNHYSIEEKDRVDEYTLNSDILMDEHLRRKNFKDTVQTPNQKGKADSMDHVIDFSNNNG